MIFFTSDFESEMAWLVFCDFSALISNSRSRSTTKLLKLPYYSRNNFLQQNLCNSDISGPIFLLKACLNSEAL